MSVGALVRSGVRFDTSQTSSLVALRNMVGVIAPMVIAVATGSPAAAGLAPTIGALQSAFADRPGPYRLRLLRMLTTAFATSVTSGLAVLCSRSGAASVLLLFVLALLGGLLLTGGPSATQVGVAGVAAALVLGHFPQPPGTAVHVGLLVLAGGAGQALLAVAAWPLGRHRPERVALATMYRELAALTRQPLDSSAAPPNVAVLTDVRKVLYGLGHSSGPSVEAYRVLLDEGERIRREVLVLGGALEWLDDDVGLRQALTRVGDVLEAIADALERGRRLDAAVLPPARRAVDTSVTALERTDRLADRAVAARLRALGGQLRAAVETATVGASEGRTPGRFDWSALRAIRSPLVVLRANLSPDSAVLRHAARLAVLVAGSDLVMRLSGFDRGYWVPLTVLVVLRPDFATTFQRSILRVVGTIIGLLVATALVHYVPGGERFQIVLIAAFVFALRFAGATNIGYVAVALSGLVVVLLEVQGQPAIDTAVSRALATLVGGALALVAILVRPSWEREYVPTRLADLLRAYREYLHAIAELDTPEATMQRMRAAARLARTNAQASLDRARAEPVLAAETVEVGDGVLAHSHRLIHALLAIDLLRPALRRVEPLAALQRVLADAEAALVDAESVLRGDGAPHCPTQLRRVQAELAEQVLADPARAGGDEAAGALVDATDRLTNSIDTLLAELDRAPAPVGQGAAWQTATS